MYSWMVLEARQSAFATRTALCSNVNLQKTLKSEWRQSFLVAKHSDNVSLGTETLGRAGVATQALL